MADPRAIVNKVLGSKLEATKQEFDKSRHV